MWCATRTTKVRALRCAPASTSCSKPAPMPRCASMPMANIRRKRPRFWRAIRRHAARSCSACVSLVKAGAPAANVFSNRFSNRFLSFAVGRTLSDTQCGLRRYPLPETLALGGRAAATATKQSSFYAPRAWVGKSGARDLSARERARDALSQCARSRAYRVSRALHARDRAQAAPMSIVRRHWGKFAALALIALDRVLGERAFCRQRPSAAQPTANRRTARRSQPSSPRPSVASVIRTCSAAANS